MNQKSKSLWAFLGGLIAAGAGLAAYFKYKDFKEDMELVDELEKEEEATVKVDHIEKGTGNPGNGGILNITDFDKFYDFFDKKYTTLLKRKPIASAVVIQGTMHLIDKAIVMDNEEKRKVYVQTMNIIGQFGETEYAVLSKKDFCYDEFDGKRVNILADYIDIDGNGCDFLDKAIIVDVIKEVKKSFSNSTTIKIDKNIDKTEEVPIEMTFAKADDLEDINSRLDAITLAVNAIFANVVAKSPKLYYQGSISGIESFGEETEGLIKVKCKIYTKNDVIKAILVFKKDDYPNLCQEYLMSREFDIAIKPTYLKDDYLACQVMSLKPV